MLSHIFNCLSEHWIFIKLKKSLSNSFFASLLNFLFISICDFNHGFCWILIILCTFFNFNPWFNACFKAVMCITYFLFSSILQTNFSTFYNVLLCGKNGKSLWELYNCFGYSVSTSRKYPSSLFSLQFYMKSSLKSDR